MEQKLEQILKTSATIDKHVAGTAALFTPPPQQWNYGPASMPVTPIYKPINPVLGGGCYLDLDRGTRNTFIIGEDVPGMRGSRLNTYIHHDRGPGRMTSEY